MGSSGLPGGDPVSRGRSLAPEHRPPLQTFSKPEDDIRNPPLDDGSIFNVESPDDLGKKNQPVPDERAVPTPSYTSPGKDVTPKTKAPYRDDRPNSKMARVLAERYMREMSKTNA